MVRTLRYLQPVPVFTSELKITFDIVCNRSTSNREDGISQALSRLNWMGELDEDAAFPDTVKVRRF
jgi:hypothetical protein